MAGANDMAGLAGMLAASALERLRGFSRLYWDASGKTWLLVGLALLVAAAAAAVAVFLKIQNRTARRVAWVEFNQRAERAGLNADERRLLGWVSRLSGAGNPSAVFTLDQFFNGGSTALVRSRRFAAASRPQRQATQALLSSIREKLGFHHSDPDIEGISSSRQIDEGSRLSMIHRGRSQGLAGTVISNNAVELIVETDQPVEARPGELWLVRYSDGGSVWEFDAPVISGAGGKVMLGHSDQLRFINRRRFARIAVRCQAHIAAFPFMLPDGGLPQFHQATLLELAGPGMMLKAPLAVKVGQKVLLVARLRDHLVIEGLGKVRRAVPRDGEWEIAVELVGLNPAEMAQLTAQTNAAAQATSARGVQVYEQQPAEPAAAGEGAPK